MGQCRHRQGLSPEPGQGLGVIRKMVGEDLDRHLALQARVGGPVYLAHTSRADGRDGRDGLVGSQSGFLEPGPYGC